jgi:hypothetical protein
VTQGYDAMLAIVTKSLGLAGGAPVAERITRTLIDESGGEFHYVQEVKGILTMQHPITERFSPTDLWDCTHLRHAEIAAAGGAFRTGKHKIWLDRGVLQWEEVS